MQFSAANLSANHAATWWLWTSMCDPVLLDSPCHRNGKNNTKASEPHVVLALARWHPHLGVTARVSFILYTRIWGCPNPRMRAAQRAAMRHSSGGSIFGSSIYTGGTRQVTQFSRTQPHSGITVSSDRFAFFSLLGIVRLRCSFVGGFFSACLSRNVWPAWQPVESETSSTSPRRWGKAF